MKRRVNGEGSIVKRKNGSYMGALMTGYRGDGSIIRKYCYGRTKGEVAAKLQTLKAEAKDNISYPKTITLATWLDYWMENYKRPKLKPTTFHNYSNMALPIYKHLGGILLKELSTIQVQQFINAVSSEYSTSSIREVFKVLRCAMNKAVSCDMINKSPCKGVELPPLIKKEVRALTIQEEQTFLKACEWHKYYPLYVMALDTGLRIGELLALTWSDVDLDGGTVSVNKNIALVKREIIPQSTPKTPSSVRKVPLTARTLKILKAMRAETSSILVFNNEGSYYNPSAVSKSLEHVINRTGLNWFTFHSLRHTFATKLFNCGVPVNVISKLLGHSKTSITMDIYVALLPNQQDEAIKALDLLNSNT